MTTYPAHVLCPLCGKVACNFTVGLGQIMALLAINANYLNRLLVRTDADKPGPSNHLLECQHCNHLFKPLIRRIIDKPRTV